MSFHIIRDQAEIASGLVVIATDIHRDQRGYFAEILHKSDFANILGDEIEFYQDNISYSRANVIRGLHFQTSPYAQAKLVRCVMGAIQDVVVDLRPDSANFGKYFCIELTAENLLQLYVPKGFAHGFAVLSDTALVEYKCDEYYMPAYDSGIRWDDDDLGIKWKINKDIAIVSEKDRNLLSFKEVRERRLI